MKKRCKLILLLGERCVRSKISKLFINGWRQPRILFVPRLKDCCILSIAFRLLEFAPETYWHQIGYLKEKDYTISQPFTWIPEEVPYCLWKSRLPPLSLCLPSPLWCCSHLVSCSSAKIAWYLLHFQNPSTHVFLSANSSFLFWMTQTQRERCFRGDSILSQQDVGVLYCQEQGIMSLGRSSTPLCSSAHSLTYFPKVFPLHANPHE